jgi:MinD-like ATPase involved in chromosome partitioning or flagellar assembly
MQPTAAGHFAPQPGIFFSGAPNTKGHPTMPFLTVYATKGGQGTTTTAAALALTANQHGQKVLLIDTGGDLPAILGHPERHGPGLSDYLTDPNVTLADIAVTISEGLDLIARGPGPITFDTYTYGLVTGGCDRYDTVIIDLGTANADPWNEHADETVFVTRPCYLAVRRSIHLPRRPSHVILINEPGRALSAHDIEVVLGVPVTATIPVDIETARIIDAGLLVTRLPQHISRALRPIIANVDGSVEVASIKVASVEVAR